MGVTTPIVPVRARTNEVHPVRYTPRCAICPSTHRCVPGDGPSPARVVCIGERPGKDEDKGGDRCFIGRAGDEFNNNYLRVAGLDRDEVWVTNTVKCRNADRDVKPTRDEIEECSRFFLPNELDRAEPEVVILMGATACSLIPDIDLDVEHGIPRFGQRLLNWSGTVIPMYHPAAGMHDTGTMIPLLEDWARVREVLEGRYVPPPPLENTNYSLLDIWEPGTRIPGLLDSASLALDTETYNSQPFSIQSCWEEGQAFFTHTKVKTVQEKVADRLLGEQLVMLDWLKFVIEDFLTPAKGAEVILHNAPQDLDTIERMGIHIPPLLIRDTMQEAYHLGNLPQGLKALAYRLLGVRMKSYLDVVMPPSREAALDWIEKAVNTVAESYQLRSYKQLKTKLKTIDKPTPQEQGLRRVLKHGCFSDTYDIWGKLKELRGKESVGDPVWARVDSTWGPVPLPGIANVPVEEAVRYGCMDADITWRVARRLKELRREKEEGIGVQEEDKDSRVGAVARRVMGKGNR